MDLVLIMNFQIVLVYAVVLLKWMPVVYEMAMDLLVYMMYGNQLNNPIIHLVVLV